MDEMEKANLALVRDYLAAVERGEAGVAIARGAEVAVEAECSATLAVPAGTIPEGGSMRAHFAMFFECEDGKIYRQRNYDCFEPW